jgi:CRP-like cAMP-binding protein
VYHICAGSFFGEIGLILARQSAQNEALHMLNKKGMKGRTATVIATTDCCLFELAEDDAYHTCE